MEIDQRCPNYPNCDEDGCQYIHPSRHCIDFPACKRGNKCIYIHPKCKFDLLCSRNDCPFTHTFTKKVSATAMRPRFQTQCRHLSKCTNKNCPFTHSVEDIDDEFEDEESLQHLSSTTDQIYSGKIIKRCPDWPTCKDGDTCQYIHPSRACINFPSCKFRNNCIYIHPKCKFDVLCTKLDCPFTHTSNKRSLPAIGKSIPLLQKSKIECKFYPRCTNKNCPFMHSKDSLTGSSIPPHETTEIVSVEKLVRVLSTSSSFSSTILSIMTKYKLSLMQVRDVVKDNWHLFLLDGEKITLKPNLSICSHHLANGCHKFQRCYSLHICKDFIDDKCSKNNLCLFGHNWKTDHNVKVLNQYCLGSVNQNVLKKLLCASTLLNKPNSPLEICLSYNSSSCLDSDCSKLHICISYIADNCSSTCALNHSFMADGIKKVLKDYNISVNETQQDFLNHIRSMNSIKTQLKSFNTALSSAVTENSAEELGNKSKIIKDNKENQLPKNSMPHKKIGTHWSHELSGDVTKPEICFLSVAEGICPYEEKGCWRLHSFEHFHWQIEETGKEWLNLPHNLVVELEENYCDVNKDQSDLSPLNPRYLEKPLWELLKLLGRKKWQADFEKMILTSNDSQEKLKLRRLQTEKTENETPEPCKHLWYFLDVNQSWIEYGNVDTSNKEKLRSNLDSKAIEAEFLKDKTSFINFSNAEFNYTLDPSKMMQTNLKTQVSRKVRRRPQPRITKKNETVIYSLASFDIFPSYWEPMKSNEQSIISIIASTSQEYIKVSSYFSLKGGNFNIFRIGRVQNPFLFKAFMNKQRGIEALYKDAAKANVQHLFHGTHPQIVQSICNENFDWRLHGSNTGQAFGRGTYFASDPRASYLYTSPDCNNTRYIFIAKVIVGRVTLGNSTITCPPLNPTTNMPYESTVDNISNPRFIVKYDKQDYYPEYILALN